MYIFVVIFIFAVFVVIVNVVFFVTKSTIVVSVVRVVVEEKYETAKRGD